MTITQKYLSWGIGIFLWIFGVNILLSYLKFNNLDWITIKDMINMALPPLLLGVGFYMVLDLKNKLARGDVFQMIIGYLVSLVLILFILVIIAVSYGYVLFSS